MHAPNAFSASLAALHDNWVTTPGRRPPAEKPFLKPTVVLPSVLLPTHGRSRHIRRRGGPSATRKPFDRRFHGVAGLGVLDRIEQLRRTRRTADQAFGIGKHQRIVPWALDDERQIEAGRG